MPQRPSTRGLIWRNGIIFGLIIPAVGIASFFIIRQLGVPLTTTVNPTTRPFDALTYLSYGVPLLSLSLMFVAGMLTARATGSVGAASLTGLVAGFVEALFPVSVVLFLAISVIRSESQSSRLLNQEWAPFVIESLIIGLLIGLITDCGIGAGMGALGGLVGARSYRKTNPPATSAQPQEPQAQG